MDEQAAEWEHRQTMADDIYESRGWRPSRSDGELYADRLNVRDDLFGHVAGCLAINADRRNAAAAAHMPWEHSRLCGEQDAYEEVLAWLKEYW